MIKPRTAVEREAIIAARRERKEKEKLDARAPQTPQRGRYRKRRPEHTQAVVVEPEIDPLDAERAGLHDEALQLGHEEINLNLGDEPSAGSEEHH